jgi:hypothetical protein
MPYIYTTHISSHTKAYIPVVEFVPIIKEAMKKFSLTSLQFPGKIVFMQALTL